MTTPFIQFTQDTREDITNSPQHYHDFKGAKIRLQLYWTKPILNDYIAFRRSLTLIEKTEAILKKYSLSLDILPKLAPNAMHVKVRARINQRLSNNAPLKQVERYIPGAVRSVASDIFNGIVDDLVDQEYAKTVGLIDYGFQVRIPIDGAARISDVQGVRELINPEPEENRLIVVFANIDGANGFTALFPKWLPWIVADPRNTDSSRAMLLHEIGHACRLGHQKKGNIMYDLDDGNEQLWAWQVDTMFDSFWCDGSRPREWWAKNTKTAYPAFLWEE